MPQFDILSFSSQIFWLILVFSFLYLLVSKIIVPKAENILLNRSCYIKENITASEDYNAKAQYLTRLKETQIETLNFEAEELQNYAVRTLEEFFLNKKNELSIILNKKTEESLLEIQNYVNSFHLNEAISTHDLASFIIEKITGKPADLKILQRIDRKN